MLQQTFDVSLLSMLLFYMPVDTKAIVTQALKLLSNTLGTARHSVVG